MQLKKAFKQGFGFAIVGGFGAVINGFVYSFLSQFALFTSIPFPFWIFGEITWAWGFGILAAFIFNFCLDKWLVFKA